VTDPTTRFSSRVDAYVKYRPSYPPQLFDTLRDECGWTASAAIADVGSGTGISAELFLKRGNLVHGVEPNREMRLASERLLTAFPKFRSSSGRAEATGLEAQSVDFVLAAQSFHWFDRDACKREFARILRPLGFVLLLWNDRLTEASPFMRAYEALLHTHSDDYASVKQKEAVPDAAIAAFFAPAAFGVKIFSNHQEFDGEGLLGRSMSSSYVPEQGHRHDTFVSELEKMFELYAVGGKVHFDYATRLYWGRLP
jgi:SAM-dependent methyltransferase